MAEHIRKKEDRRLGSNARSTMDRRENPAGDWQNTERRHKDDRRQQQRRNRSDRRDQG